MPVAKASNAETTGDPEPAESSPLPGEPPRTSLADLAVQAKVEEFKLPEIDAGKIATAGIRKLAGKHITLYTDVPAAPDVDELPTVFDAAVPLLCEYCGVDPKLAADWHIIGYLMQDKERFLGTGLYPENLPPFPHGYSRGGEIWLYDQPSGYYRRHLMIHEGTHAFMHRMLGGSGPPWYMEGTAELLGTHRWQAGKLTLAYMPKTKDEVPYWGRVKIVRDEFAAGRGMQLVEIMKYDNHAHQKNEPYGWCWAAAAFLNQHPLTQEQFRALRSQTRDRSIDFSRRFYDSLKPHWRAINEDWQLFVRDIDYGYDIARAAVVRKPASALPAAGATVEIAANRGWQSSGFRLEAGKSYLIEGAGRFTIANDGAPWPCEPSGVTIRYHNGQPLGILQAAVSDEEQPPPAMTPLALPQAIGLSAKFATTGGGTLYLRLNEAASGLADNVGSVATRIRPQ